MCHAICARAIRNLALIHDEGREGRATRGAQPQLKTTMPCGRRRWKTTISLQNMLDSRYFSI